MELGDIIESNSLKSQNEWLNKLSIIYKLYLNEEIKKNKENIEKCRDEVKKFWLDNMNMPPLLECYDRSNNRFILDIEYIKNQHE